MNTPSHNITPMVLIPEPVYNQLLDTVKILDTRIAAIHQTIVQAAGEKANNRTAMYTKSKAAVYLQISEATIDRLIAGGLLKFARKNPANPRSQLLFRRADLDSFIEKQTEPPQKARFRR